VKCIEKPQLFEKSTELAGISASPISHSLALLNAKIAAADSLYSQIRQI
jgi:hypothetical protein